MPVIASHHKWEHADHKPLTEWPDDCFVQWGRKAVAQSDKSVGSFGTAFFEAFPANGDCIRGEGASIAEAERNALETFRRIAACDHHWSRGGYASGGAVCLKCKGYNHDFKPIVTLGSFRDPLEISMICRAAAGRLRPDPADPRVHKGNRLRWLKARRAGIALPDFYSAPPEPECFTKDEYGRSCREAVIDFLRANREAIETGKGWGVAGLFDTVGHSKLKSMLREADAAEEAAVTQELTMLDLSSGPMF